MQLKHNNAIVTIFSAICAVILHFQSINFLDSSAMTMLALLKEDLDSHDIQVLVTSVKGPVRDAMQKGGLDEVFGKDHRFMSIKDAMEYIDNDLQLEQRPLRPYTLQSNFKSKTE